MLRISILLQSVASVHALSTSQSRLQNALDRLHRNPSVDACLDVIRHVPHSTPVDKTRLRALADEDDAALSTRFFDAKPCDDAVRALARGDDEAITAVPVSPKLILRDLGPPRAPRRRAFRGTFAASFRRARRRARSLPPLRARARRGGEGHGMRARLQRGGTEPSVTPLSLSRACPRSLSRSTGRPRWAGQHATATSPSPRCSSPPGRT